MSIFILIAFVIQIDCQCTSRRGEFSSDTGSSDAYDAGLYDASSYDADAFDGDVGVVDAGFFDADSFDADAGVVDVGPIDGDTRVVDTRSHDGDVGTDDADSSDVGDAGPFDANSLDADAGADDARSRDADAFEDPCRPCVGHDMLNTWSGLSWSCASSNQVNANGGATTPNICNRAGAGDLVFQDFDEVNLAPNYVMSNGFGNDAQCVSIGTSRWYSDWTQPPLGDDGSGIWYRFETKYMGGLTSCDDGAVVELQVGHRYISAAGILFEIGGQPDWELGDPRFNVYADVDGAHEPIVIAPNSASSGQEYFSEWWSAANPFQAAPVGYPTASYEMADIIDPGTGAPVGKNYIYSQASILGELDAVSISVPGRGSKTYFDVVIVLWRHGTKLLEWGGGPVQQFGAITCQDPDIPEALLLDGWSLYGSVRFYAKHNSALGQQGGPILDQLLWQCRKLDDAWVARGVLAEPDSRTNAQSYTWYRRWW